MRLGDKLPVIFRAQMEDGRLWITAVFPTEPATCTGADDFTIYQHVGQHGAGTLGWYRRTRPATAAEYAPLLAELRGIYETSYGDTDPTVPLVVRHRMARMYTAVRREARDRFRHR